mmetsp:Transcript_59995/g.99592  ORF Transcript_59995/g.99592 Transcript_59995/m.99592 type:complete len:89 (+) Transcript_59995:986-1252(+)
MRCLSDPHSRQGLGQSRDSWFGSSQLWQAPGPRFVGAVTSGLPVVVAVRAERLAVLAALLATLLPLLDRELSTIPPLAAQRTAILAHE